MKKQTKTLILSIVVTLIILLTFTITYAAFVYRQTGDNNHQLILGDIYMYYNETDTVIDIDNMLPEDLINEDLIIDNTGINPVMAQQEAYTFEDILASSDNELTKCVNYLTYIWGKEEVGLNIGIDKDYQIQEGETYEAFCRETGTLGGLNFASALHEGMLSNYNNKNGYYVGLSFEELVDLNIMIDEFGEGQYHQNPILQTQELGNVTDEFNELSKCVSIFKYDILDFVYNYETVEPFCRGTESTLYDLTFDTYIEENYDVLLANNIILSERTLKENEVPYFEFTISGENTYTKQDIKYEIILNNSEYTGEDKEVRNQRIADEYLKFALVEMIDEKANLIVVDQSYNDIVNQIIHTDTISSDEGLINRVYRLYMWIDEDLVIGNTSDAVYSTDEWSKIYASIRVDVKGSL